MPAFRLAIRSPAAEALRHLPPDIKRAVKSALRVLCADPAAGEPLQNELEGLWKYRVRRFRLVYKVDRNGKTIDIIAIGERRSIYEEVTRLLRSQK